MGYPDDLEYLQKKYIFATDILTVSIMNGFLLTSFVEKQCSPLKKLLAFVVFATFQYSRDGGVGLIFLIISIVITISIILTIFIKIRIIIQFSKAGDVGRRSVFFSSEKLASSDPRLQSAQNGSVISVPVFVNTTRIFLRYV